MARATTFTEDEAARILGLTIPAFNELLTNGRLQVVERGGTTRIAAEQLEAFLRDALLSLYRAEAAAPIQDGDDGGIEITRSIADYVEPRAGRPNLRVAPRYKPRRPIAAKFAAKPLSILQLSTSGLRVRHDETFRPGQTASLTFSVGNPPHSVAVKAQIIWTSIAQSGDEPSYCISGVTIIDGREKIRDVIEELRAGEEVQLDSGRIGVKASANTAPAALASLSDDDVASIIRAVRRFSSDPVEAGRWYSRARFALADEDVRKHAPARGRDREEVLGIWEFLGRRLEIKDVAGVMAWLRQTRSAAAMS
jgi:excisionase family DNA binding protein